MHRASLGLTIGAAITAIAFAAPAKAQVADRSIEEIKSETLARAERGAYPVNGLDIADVRNALAAIKTRDPDDWAQGWAAVAQRYVVAAQSSADPADADANYLRAWRPFQPVLRVPESWKSVGQVRHRFRRNLRGHTNANRSRSAHCGCGHCGACTLHPR